MAAMPPLILPPDGLLPSLAPLNASRVAQILHAHIASASVIEAVRQYPHSLVWLHRVLPAVREQVAADVAPFARIDSLSVHTFVSLLHPAATSTNRIDTTLLSYWRGRGLIQTSRRGFLEPQRAAAVLIARRLLPMATRNWLPNEVAPSEPLWWCWRQDTPGSPITTCPVPLPSDLPAAALLWVPWSGAAWLPDWVPVATGALYCGGIHTTKEALAAAQLWHRADDPTVAFPMEPNDQPADAATVRQMWVQLMRPIVTERFTPIVP